MASVLSYEHVILPAQDLKVIRVLESIWGEATHSKNMGQRETGNENITPGSPFCVCVCGCVCLKLFTAMLIWESEKCIKVSSTPLAPFSISSTTPKIQAFFFK